MRKSSKGFTLIELLAVIVILAIIALITTPVILNVIEESRLNSAKDKAWGTIDAVRVAYATAQTGEQEIAIPYTVNFAKAPGSTTATNIGYGKINDTEIKVSGEKPTDGTVNLAADGTITATSLKFGNYYCSTIDGKNGSVNANKMYCSRTADDVKSK